MAESKSTIEIKVLPQASESVHKFVENYNWFGRNYRSLVENFGRPCYVAVHECKVIDSDKNLRALQERLCTIFSKEEYDSTCIGEL